MARTVKNTKSPEERRAEAEALQATIAEQVEALRESETWARFLTFAQSFHRYSLGNLLLIFAQCPEASHVAGYRTWQKLNRQVRKGERGIRIFGGRDVRETVENEQTGEEEEQRRVRFFPVSVFDMGQTDLIDEEAGDPADIARQLTGDDPAGIFDAVADYLTGKGWTVEREQIAGGANGYTTTDGTQRVVIDADLSPAQAAKTALHEAAHVILHAEEDHAEYVEHRGSRKPRPRASPTSSPGFSDSTRAPTASATSPGGASARPRRSSHRGKRAAHRARPGRRDHRARPRARRRVTRIVLIPLGERHARRADPVRYGRVRARGRGRDPLGRRAPAVRHRLPPPRRPRGRVRAVDRRTRELRMPDALAHVAPRVLRSAGRRR